MEDARSYVERVILSSYRQHGFGLLVVELRQEGVPMGLCGLIRREGLEDVDVGFALLPRFRGRGHAREPVEAVLDLARREHGLARLVAVTAPDNAASIAVLGGAGFRREGLVRLAPGGPELELHAIGPARGG